VTPRFLCTPQVGTSVLEEPTIPGFMLEGRAKQDEMVFETGKEGKGP
jgi:hypothetical protein